MRSVPSRSASDLLGYLTHTRRTAGAILDLGCGTGRNAVFFASKGYQVCGADFVVDLESHFKALANQLGKENQLYFALQDLRQPLSFHDQAFDVVSGFTVIENLIEDQSLIQLSMEVYRVLRPAGLFAIYYLTPKDGFYGPRKTAGSGDRHIVWAEDTNMVQRVFSESEIMNLFSAGFSRVHLKNYNFDDHRFGKVYHRHLQLAIFEKQAVSNVNDGTDQ